MADIESSIRFIADVSQAVGQMRVLMGQAEQLDRTFAKVSRGIQQAQVGPNTAFANSAFDAREKGITNRPVALPPRREYDQFNQTLKTTYDSIVLNSQGEEVFRTSLTRTHGDMRLVTSEAERYGAAARKAAGSTANFTNELANQRRAIDALKAPYYATINTATQAADQARIDLANARTARAALPQQRVTASAYEIYQINQVEAEILRARNEIQRNTGIKNFTARDLSRDPLIQQEEAKLARLQQILPSFKAYEDEIRRLGDRALQRAQNAPPPLPTSLETVRRESPNLFNRLVAGGLGKDENNIFSTQQIYKQGGDNLQLTRDLERNVTQLRGSYRGLNGELINVNAAYAEGGRVIGRYGGVLSGTQNFLRQTVNNFQKVVQWGLATTAVFAGIGFATQAFDTVSNLDKSLNQLAITAQLSSKQVAGVFDSLATIAYNTATPLQEMVKAADDIALATKRANQSTQTWQENIESLASSVGILTNISGLDTVKATDLLTSTMKQLNLEASDLIGILNKVTAVAGGQANSITDIVAGLGSMAEAAQTASLNIDETIGVVQVLGQVTSKSSAEIATSFKNLVGSVDSVGGKKALDKFGISTRDAEGNLKNILQIYEEIQAKIRSGVIPQADIKDLIKGIAGGPRRAPDASALLANVDAIREAQARSAAATNEALVANVKYLDTIQAKITQLAVKFQTAIQKSLGPGIKSFVTDVGNVLNTLLDLLSGLDAGFIKTGLQVTALIVGLKVLLTTGKFLAGIVTDLKKGLFLFDQAAALGTTQIAANGVAMSRTAAQTAVAITEIDALILAHRQQGAAALAAGDAELFAAKATQIAGLEALKAAEITNAANRSRFAGLGAGLRGALPALGIGLATGSLSAATGSTPGQSIGAGLQGAGLTLLLGAPIPHAKALGAALLAVGTGLQLITGETKKATEATRANSTEVLTAINQYREAQATIASLTDSQKSLSNYFKILTQDSKESENNMATIVDTLEQYGQGIVDLTEANEALAASYEELKQKVPAIDAQFGQQIADAKKGLLDAKDLKELQIKIYEELFRGSNPELFVQNGSLIRPSAVGPLTRNGSSIASITPALNYGRGGAFGEQSVIDPLAGKQREPITVDLANLKEASEVLKIFNSTGTAIVANFDKTSVNLDAIKGALTSIVEEGGTQAEVAKAALITYENQLAVLTAIGQAEVLEKQITALLTVKQLTGEITAEEQQRGLKNAKLYKDLIEVASKLPSAGNLDLPNGGQRQAPIDTSEGLQQAAQKIFFTKQGTIQLDKISIDNARLYLEQMGYINDLLNDGKELTNDEIAIIADKVGLSVDYTSELLKQKEITEEMAKLEEDMNALRTSNTDTLANSIRDAQKQFLSGDITKKQRDELIKTANATKTLSDRFVELYQQAETTGQGAETLNEALSKLPGLENLVGKGAADAAAELINYVDGMDLTRKGTILLRDEILKLILAIEFLPKYRRMVLEVITVQSTVNSATGRNVKDARAFQSLETKVNQQAGNSATKALEDFKKLLASIGGNKNYSTLGAGGSSSSGAGAGLDVSQIDLPEELYGVNQNALIQQAIKRARALQKTIPGATKEASNDVVSILKGTQNLLTVRGVKDDLLRRALEELADIEKKRLEYETKADTIRRIRVGGGDFSAIANVPVNSRTGVSLGNSQGPINVTLNLNGSVLTPAQLAQFADLVAASLKRQIAG